MDKCENCGSTNIGTRNAYKRQHQNPHNPTVGFAAEEYCKDCGLKPKKSKLQKILNKYVERIREEAKNMVS